MSTTTTNSGGHPKTTALLGEAAAGASRPETFRLPKVGGDPFFGFGRSFYYEGEKRGYWRLIRIRERGKLRGVTLVPFDAVASFVRKQMQIGAANAEE
ncbi:MAG TPA: hypothetical protein VGQ95_09965 [Chthoniobacterales bacterium]|nr:hypothetical protein [Chthoniobacterales bacterium]